MSLDLYRTLGRSGLRVSRLSLGTMTFGEDWGWGADEQESRRIFDAYVERGGNFVDTANFYTNGSSETLLGRFIAGRRDSLVVATKYSLNLFPDDPNGGGNHRKSLMRAVEGSLRRLGTDYIDLLYLHAWDALTPVDEVMRGFDDLVRAGKVLYAGMSDAPAWQVARMQTLAGLRGWATLVALQIPYSLAERTVERELMPMAQELGLGVLAWSPLASGMLTGKYGRDDLDYAGRSVGDAGTTRKDVVAAIGALTPRALEIVEVVKQVATEQGRSPAQVAIAWTLLHPSVAAPILGARTLAQLEDNLGALEVSFDDDQLRRLEAASAIELGFPHDFMALPQTRQVLFGNARVARRADTQASFGPPPEWAPGTRTDPPDA